MQQTMEIELKFALPNLDRLALETWLCKLPVMSRHKPIHLQLHNVYYDTPEQALRGRKMALRMRRIGSPGQPQWVQTLKIAGQSESALSQRGEWEFQLTGKQLDFNLLQKTPWRDCDPDGQLFDALRPCFTTDFERTCWTLRRPDGSRVEIALDQGQVSSDGQTTALCELEFELLSGAPSALFDTARRIAESVPLIPLNVSKAERGYRLAQGTLHAPVRARPVGLSPSMGVPKVANQVLREMFLQFCANLNIFRASDDPEVVHQARVGWRRFRSALKFFGKDVDLGGLPTVSVLQPLMQRLTRLRDLEVAASETLPMLAGPYTAGDPMRQGQWTQLVLALADEVQTQRLAVHAALDDPAVGLTLLEMTRWLETPWTLTGSASALCTTSVSAWAWRRTAKLIDRLDVTAVDAHDPLIQHRARIVSKRLRYCIEAVRPLLPKRRAQRAYQLAAQLQTRLGSNRDVLQAIEIASQLGAADGIVAFLRGVSVGQSLHA